MSKKSSKSYDIDGHAATAIIRFLSKQGFGRGAIAAALERLGVKGMSRHTVNTMHWNGQHGVYPIPKLSKKLASKVKNAAKRAQKAIEAA